MASYGDRHHTLVLALFLVHDGAGPPFRFRQMHEQRLETIGTSQVFRRMEIHLSPSPSVAPFACSRWCGINDKTIPSAFIMVLSYERNGGEAMNKNLQTLLEAAKKVGLTEEDKEQQ